MKQPKTRPPGSQVAKPDGVFAGTDDHPRPKRSFDVTQGSSTPMITIQPQPTQAGEGSPQHVAPQPIQPTQAGEGSPHHVTPQPIQPTQAGEGSPQHVAPQPIPPTQAGEGSPHHVTPQPRRRIARHKSKHTVDLSNRNWNRMYWAILYVNSKEGRQYKQNSFLDCALGEKIDRLENELGTPFPDDRRPEKL